MSPALSTLPPTALAAPLAAVCAAVAAAWAAAAVLPFAAVRASSSPSCARTVAPTSPPCGAAGSDASANASARSVPRPLRRVAPPWETTRRSVSPAAAAAGSCWICLLAMGRLHDDRLVGVGHDRLARLGREQHLGRGWAGRGGGPGLAGDPQALARDPQPERHRPRPGR